MQHQRMAAVLDSWGVVSALSSVVQQTVQLCRLVGGLSVLIRPAWAHQMVGQVQQSDPWHSMPAVLSCHNKLCRGLSH